MLNLKDSYDFDIVITRFKKHLFYKNKLKNIKSFYDIPFMEKEDYKNFINFVNTKNLKETCVCASSGTTKNPILSLFSKKDYERAINRIVLGMKMTGINSKDVILNTFSYGIFMAGFLYDYAARAMKCCILPFGSGKMTPTIIKLKLCQTIKPTVINSTPYYLFRLSDLAKKEGLEDFNSHLRIIQCAGEPLKDKLRKKINKLYPHIEIFNQYGMTEAPSLAAECKYHEGMHVFDEDYYIEVIDECEKNVENGEGELVVTSLNQELMPVLRFKTGDYVKIIRNKCKCGRISPRIEVLHRKGDIKKIKGVLCNIQLLYETLFNMGLKDFYFEYKRTKNKFGLILEKQVNKDLLKRINNKVYNKFGIHINYIKFDSSMYSKTITGKKLKLVEI